MTVYNFRDAAFWSLLMVVVDAVGSSSAPSPAEKLKLEIDHNAELLRREKPDGASSGGHAAKLDIVASSGDDDAQLFTRKIQEELRSNKLGGDKDKDQPYQNLLPAGALNIPYPALPAEQPVSPDEDVRGSSSTDPLTASAEDKIQVAIEHATAHSNIGQVLPNGPHTLEEAQWLVSEVERDIIDAETAAGYSPTDLLVTTTTTTEDENDSTAVWLFVIVGVILFLLAGGFATGYVVVNKGKFGYGEDTSYKDLIPDSENEEAGNANQVEENPVDENQVEENLVEENPNPAAEISLEESH